MMIIHCPTQVPSPLCLLKSASWPFSAPTKRCFKRVSYFRKLPCDNNNLTFKYLPCQQTKSAILWTIEFTNAYIYINKKRRKDADDGQKRAYLLFRPVQDKEVEQIKQIQIFRLKDCISFLSTMASSGRSTQSRQTQRKLARWCQARACLIDLSFLIRCLFCQTTKDLILQQKQNEYH